MDGKVNVGLYWLIIYTIVSFTDCNEPTKCHQEYYISCGEDTAPCHTVICPVKNRHNVDQIYVIRHTANCKSNVGYDGEYIWTRNCCRVVAHICYIDDNLERNIAPDIIYGRRFEPENSNAFSPIANTSMREIIDEATPIKKAENRDKESPSVGLYVGIALGIVTILVVIVTVCFICRKTIKRHILWRKRQKNSREEDLNFPVYQSPENISFPCKMFSNLEYDMTLEATQVFHFPVQISDNSAHRGVNQITARHPRRDSEVAGSDEAHKADSNVTEIAYNRPCKDFSASFGSDHVYDLAIQTPSSDLILDKQRKTFTSVNSTRI
ncbi:hypothetical protein CHS0354_013524 [Potamilus streckersoni]|uniref:Uncharacterized protein n=1 Tax=Potamilus streckersoni TaxID=2493646 RepID=A0AAE0T9G3_9BIVA|nr:hypothetical protein CHS0354_013524 [Potamilus streckersoni]